MYGWIGDSAKDLEVALYCDADFAGDKADAKSQSGMFLTIAGKSSSFPVNAFSKKQGSTAKSTPEEEIVAANDAIKVALPHLDLWEKMFNRKKMCIKVMEDNKSALRVLASGKNPTMSYMVRTQRVDVQWLHERISIDKDCELILTPTDSQAADILTKYNVNKHKWNANMMLINHFTPEQIKGHASTTSNIAVAETEVLSIQPFDVIPKGNTVRTIVEICTGPNSLIGSVAKDKHPDCAVYRITEQRDFRKESTLNFAMKLASPNTLYWYALPCTGGSKWFNQQTQTKRCQATKGTHPFANSNNFGRK
jgi:hypothetical protein